jgi:GNAT superfamily N-acetyltransferase
MRIRRFSPDDLPGVIRISEGLGWDSFPTDPERAVRALTAPGVTTVVADEAGEVAGFAQLQSDGEIQAHLSVIAVDPAHRREGLGREMIAEALRLAGGLRIDLITDDADAFYRALPHFRRSGYRLYPDYTGPDNYAPGLFWEKGRKAGAPTDAESQVAAPSPASEPGRTPSFSAPMINLFSDDLVCAAAFYEGLGFVETFRTPPAGPPDHVQLTLDAFTLGIATKEAAARHGVHPGEGRGVEIVLWTDNADAAAATLTASGARLLSGAHDFLEGRLRSAWVADPDGNPIQLVQRTR